jgi:hypothetical protein
MLKIVCVCYSLLFILQNSISQNCEVVSIDVKKGTVNNINPKSTQQEVIKTFPCKTGQTADGSSINCGGGVFYSNLNIYFYTGKDNINVRKGYKGKCTIDVLDKNEKELTKIFGIPDGDLIDDEKTKYTFYKTSYGCIVFIIKDGKSTEFFMYGKNSEEVDICS